LVVSSCFYGKIFRVDEKQIKAEFDTICRQEQSRAR
jgi:hypothetical protein